MMNAILAVKKEMDFENFESGSLFYLSPGLTWSNKCPRKGLKFLGHSGSEEWVGLNI